MNKKLRKMGINLSRTIFKSIRNELGGKLRLVITGAAALSPTIYRNFEDLGITVLQGFGMRSDEMARNARIFKAFNSDLVVVQDSTKVIIDSVNFIGPLLKK